MSIALNSRVILVNITWILVNLILLWGQASADLGCAIVPSISGNHKVQDDVLKNLKDHGLFGKRFSCTHKSGSFAYDFVVCGDASDKKPNAAVTRRVVIEGTEDAIGMRNATTVTGHDSGNWVMINFGGGDVDSQSICHKNVTMSSSVMIICDLKAAGDEFSLLYEDESYCRFMFELRTASLCDGHSGLSGWSIFLLIIFVGALSYFVAGFCYLRFMIGAKGIDQIPHRQFWFMVGDKLADGCGAVCRCSQYCGVAEADNASIHSPYSSEYSPIGEGGPSLYSGHPNNRDAPLLNP